MKLTKHRRNNTMAFNMTPMIDIVFLLIIFFMTVSQITRTVDYPIDLSPVDEGGVLSRPAMVTLNLNKHGRIIVGGKAVTSESALGAIRNELEKQNNNHDRIKIQLRCDRNCPSRYVNELVRRLSNMGFRHIDTAVAGR